MKTDFWFAVIISTIWGASGHIFSQFIWLLLAIFFVWLNHKEMKAKKIAIGELIKSKDEFINSIDETVENMKSESKKVIKIKHKK